MAMLVMPMPIVQSPNLHLQQRQITGPPSYAGLAPCRSPTQQFRNGCYSVLPPPVTRRSSAVGQLLPSPFVEVSESRLEPPGSALVSERVLPQQQAVRFFCPSPSLPPPRQPIVAPPVRPAVISPLWPTAQPVAEVPASAPINSADILAWSEAARAFEMNTDFDVSAALIGGKCRELPDLMLIMKQQSEGKRTIQALADKLMMHKMLDNLGVPQLPVRLSVQALPNEADIENFVVTQLCRPGAEELVLKPSHLSNASGVMCLSQPPPHEVQACVQYITQHVCHFMGVRAGSHESVAMQDLRPGFLAQPKYQSVVGFEAPLELRVICLWGKARLAVWWWGRNAGGPGENPARNAWLVRRLRVPGRLSEDDPWESIHQHTGNNPGFDKAITLFERHIVSIAATAEAIATAVGAPFLRTDFFVGSPTWGVRLNEIAYGCGCDYRNLAADGSGRMVDDGPTVAQILQEGLRYCRRRFPSEYFLSRLGVRGHAYHHSIVVPLLPALKPILPERALRGESDPRCWDCAVPDTLCKTLQPSHSFTQRSITCPSRSRISYQPPTDLMSQYNMKCGRCNSWRLALHAHVMG
mmetsp:Transcript_13178/g.23779  ORF Transcript_13178/g.23779 Transcript_13178/m.23779 type:complete len:582 (-) Transcript_13178:161-1906(-)